MSAYSEALTELRQVKAQLRLLHETRTLLNGNITPEVSKIIDDLEQKHAHLYIAVRELRKANLIR
jgi:hypothetical protein